MNRSLFIIGEAPSRKAPPGTPAFAGKVGERLTKLLGERFENVACVVNVFNHPQPPNGKGSAFDRDAAREKLRAIFESCAGEIAESRAVVLAGKRVAAAAGFGDLAFWERSELPVRTADGWAWVTVTVMPHPSAVNRYWNEPVNRRIAERELRRLRKGQRRSEVSK